jgi:hypothetical protein
LSQWPEPICTKLTTAENFGLATVAPVLGAGNRQLVMHKKAQGRGTLPTKSVSVRSTSSAQMLQIRMAQLKYYALRQPVLIALTISSCRNNILG